MEDGFDLLVRSIVPGYPDTEYVVTVSHKGVFMKRLNGNMISPKFYKFIDIHVIKVFKHYSEIYVEIATPYGVNKEEYIYRNLDDASLAFHMFRRAIKKSNVDVKETRTMILHRAAYRVKAGDMILMFDPIIEFDGKLPDYIIEKLEKTFNKVYWGDDDE